MGNYKRILLIEDNPDDQFFFKEAIKGISDAPGVSIANNGKEALDVLKKAAELPDLIFTDINMPVMGGIECLTELLKLPKMRDIPVVVLSSDTSVVELVRSMGARGFIKKPDGYGMLMPFLERIIHGDLDTLSFISSPNISISQEHSL